MAKLSISDSNEVNQSIIRLIIVVLIFSYVIIFTYISNEYFDAESKYLLLLFIIISTIEVIWSFIFLKGSLNNSHKTYFRVIANIADNFFLTIAMIKLGYIGMPLIFIYLWVTFGVGLRYGRNYLMFSAILNIISFSAVIYYSDKWHTPTLYLLASGLFISFFILPAYVYILIFKLTNALEAEKKANATKESFLENINHELRAPMASIVSMSEIMFSKKLPKKISDQLHMIQVSARLALDLINSILDVSKLRANNNKIEYRKFNLSEVIRDVTNIVAPQAINKNLILYHYIDINCNEQYIGPLEQINHILINLFSNAIKFTEKGYVALTANVIVKEGNLHQITFRLEDTGVGIAGNYKNIILKPYEQIKKDNYDNLGSGLGISIANDLANMVGGVITFNSTPNVGTIFDFKLNLKPENSNSYLFHNEFFIIVYFLNYKHKEMFRFYEKMGLNIKFCDSWEQIETYYANFGELIIFIDVGIYNIVNLKMMYHSYSEVQFILIKDIYDKSIDNKYYGVTTILYKDPSEKHLIRALNICSIFFHFKNENVSLANRLWDKLKILVVEDDVFQGQVYKEILGEYAGRLDILDEGNKAMNVIGKHHFDVIILDLNLPDTSGIELAKQIFDSLPPKLPIVFLVTAENILEVLSDETLNIFDEIITKPFSPIGLISTIEKHFLKNETDNFSVYVQEEYMELIDFDFLFGLKVHVGKVGFEKLVQTYVQEINACLDKYFQECSDNKEFEIKNILHQMKGSSSEIGALKFHQFVCEIIDKDNFYLSIQEWIKAYKKLVKIHNNTTNGMIRLLVDDNNI